MKYRRYIAVTGARKAEDIDPYLYRTARRVLTVQNPSQFAGIVLVETDQASDVDYIARYQADRLRSGLFGVSPDPVEDVEDIFRTPSFVYALELAGISVSALKEAVG